MAKKASEPAHPLALAMQLAPKGGRQHLDFVLFVKDWPKGKDDTDAKKRVLTGMWKAPSERRPTARYKAGEWYDNMPPEHIEAAVAGGFAKICHFDETCGCLITDDGQIAKLGMPMGYACSKHDPQQQSWEDE